MESVFPSPGHLSEEHCRLSSQGKNCGQNEVAECFYHLALLLLQPFFQKIPSP